MLPTIMLPGGDCLFEAAGRVLHLIASFEIRLDLGEEPLAGVGRKPPLEMLDRTEVQHGLVTARPVVPENSIRPDSHYEAVTASSQAMLAILTCSGLFVALPSTLAQLNIALRRAP
jgi:hypothetical protein